MPWLRRLWQLGPLTLLSDADGRWYFRWTDHPPRRVKSPSDNSQNTLGSEPGDPYRPGTLAQRKRAR
jgi:hypothetical protein